MLQPFLWVYKPGIQDSQVLYCSFLKDRFRYQVFSGIRVKSTIVNTRNVTIKMGLFQRKKRNDNGTQIPDESMEDPDAEGLTPEAAKKPKKKRPASTYNQFRCVNGTA